MHQNKQKTIRQIVNITGCCKRDAQEALEDILHMDNLQRHPPQADIRDHHYTTVVVSNREIEQQTANIPTCPTCGSTRLKKLDVVDRGLSFAVFGFGSNKVGKSFKCKNCGYTW
jgi:predicted RNA-binding Zn-ribbon protein involved in translation (DUF1610 family)